MQLCSHAALQPCNPPMWLYDRDLCLLASITCAPSPASSWMKSSCRVGQWEARGG